MDWVAPMSVLFPSVQGAVLLALWRRPVPMTGRQVHRVSAVGSYTGTLAALGRLVDEGLVDARPVGQASEYTLNTEHVLYPVLEAALEAFNPRQGLERHLEGLVHEHLGPREKHATLAFFGSFARGEAGVSSDIDLLLVLPEDVDLDAETQLVDDLEHRGRRWTGNKVQVYAVRPSGLTRAIEMNDPILDSWDREARTFVGAEIRQRLAQLRREGR